MDAKEFIEEFKKIADQYDWELRDNRLIRGFRKDTECGCCKQCFCPITAVVREKTLLAYASYHAMSVAFKHLDMPSMESLKIVEAADFDNKKVYCHANSEIREQLIRAANLINL